MRTDAGPLTAVEQMQAATNSHDLDAMVACFAPEYESTFPVHPDRAFQGYAQVRKNWEQIFGSVPDIRMDMMRSSVDGETVWAEWEWTGTRRDGAPFLQRGVTIQGVAHGKLAWARLYMEPVQMGGGGDAAIRQEFSAKDRT